MDASGYWRDVFATIRVPRRKSPFRSWDVLGSDWRIDVSCADGVCLQRRIEWLKSGEAAV